MAEAHDGAPETVMVAIAYLTQTWGKGDSTQEVPPSSWPVDMSVGVFS